MVTPDTDWFSESPDLLNKTKMHILERLFIMVSLRPTSAITMLSTQHCDVTHLCNNHAM